MSEIKIFTRTAYFYYDVSYTHCFLGGFFADILKYECMLAIFIRFLYYLYIYYDTLTSTFFFKLYNIALQVILLIYLWFAAPEVVNYEPLGLEADMW